MFFIFSLTVEHGVLLFNITLGHSELLDILTSFFRLVTFVSFFHFLNEYWISVFRSLFPLLFSYFNHPTPHLLFLHILGICHSLVVFFNHKYFVHSGPLCSLAVLLSCFFLFSLWGEIFLISQSSLVLLHSNIFRFCGCSIFSITAKDSS